MAKETITLGINLRKNNNSHSRAYGKYYPEVDRTDTLSLRGFAEHLTRRSRVPTRTTWCRPSTSDSCSQCTGAAILTIGINRKYLEMFQ